MTRPTAPPNFILHETLLPVHLQQQQKPATALSFSFCSTFSISSTVWVRREGRKWKENKGAIKFFPRRKRRKRPLIKRKRETSVPQKAVATTPLFLPPPLRARCYKRRRKEEEAGQGDRNPFSPFEASSALPLPGHKSFSASAHPHTLPPRSPPFPLAAIIVHPGTGVRTWPVSCPPPT